MLQSYTYPVIILYSVFLLKLFYICHRQGPRSGVVEQAAAAGDESTHSPNRQKNRRMGIAQSTISYCWSLSSLFYNATSYPSVRKCTSFTILLSGKCLEESQSNLRQGMKSSPRSDQSHHTPKVPCVQKQVWKNLQPPLPTVEQPQDLKKDSRWKFSFLPSS